MLMCSPGAGSAGIKLGFFSGGGGKILISFAQEDMKKKLLCGTEF